MYLLLCLVVTGILGYFMPNWICNLSWKELINCLNGTYDKDAYASLQIFNKIKGQINTEQELNEFFQEQLIICIAIIVAIFIGMLIITSIIKKCVSKK